MAVLNPYLNFNGNAEEAFNFYKSVFGGEFLALQRFSDMPSETQMPPGADLNRILHVSLPISKETVLMGSDVPSSFTAAIIGTNFNVSIHTETEEEATKLFNGLSEGGQVTMPLTKVFWGSYFGMFTDKFGIQWMVNHDYNQHKD